MSGNNPLAAIFPHLKKTNVPGVGINPLMKPGPKKEGGGEKLEIQENAAATNAITNPSTSSNNVDYTILIAIFVVAGILFLALLIWAIYSTQSKLPIGEHHHIHHEQTKESENKEGKKHRRSSGRRRRSRA